MKARKLPLREPLKATQNSSFSEQVTSSERPATTVAVEGKLPDGLKASGHGTSLTISGTPKKPGDYEVTIVEKRTSTITIHVSPAQSVWERPLWTL